MNLYLILTAILSISEIKTQQLNLLTITTDARFNLSLSDHDLNSGREDNLGLFLARPMRLFYDDYEKKDMAFSDLTFLMFRVQQKNCLFGIDTEVALATDLLIRYPSIDFMDGASYIKLSRNIGIGRLIFTGFPFDANRIHLGYSRRISWGSNAFKAVPKAPGVKLVFVRPNFYYYVAAKTSISMVVQSDNTTGEKTVYGVLSGLGWEPIKTLSLEISGAYFYRGIIDKLELFSVGKKGKSYNIPPWRTYGLSTRLSHQVGMENSRPVDFKHFTNDMRRTDSLFSAHKYSEDLSYLVDAEVTLLYQRLQNPENYKSTKPQIAMAGDLSARFQLGHTSFGTLLYYRDLTYILFNVPSIIPYVDIPKELDVHPEIAGVLFFEHYFDAIELNTGVSAGIKIPANTKVSNQKKLRTSIYYDLYQRVAIDSDSQVKPLFETKVSASSRISDYIAVAFEFLFQRNPNYTYFKNDDLGFPIRYEKLKNTLGINFLMRGRF